MMEKNEDENKNENKDIIEYKIRLTIWNVLKSSANDTLYSSSIHSVNR
jgi:hypothetical protein